MTKTPFDWIRDFLVLCTQPSFRRASEELGMSPAALSLRIRALEAHLGLPLLEWRGRTKILSPVGIALRDSLLTRYQELDSRVENVRGRFLAETAGLFRVAGRSEVCSHASSIFKDQARLEFVFCTSQEALRKVVAGEAEFAITYFEPDSTDFIQKPLFKSECHLLSSLPQESLSDLVQKKEAFAEARWISYLREDPFLLRVCKHHGLKLSDLKIVATCEDWNSISGFVAAGIGSAITPEYILPPDTKRVSVQKLSKALFPAYQYNIVCSTGLLKISGYQKFFKGLKPLQP